MKIKDKELKQWVDVAFADCTTLKCYLPTTNPGTFNQGYGHSSSPKGAKRDWVCRHRDVHGCPDTKEKK